jgi:hypothetical protein
MSGKHICQWVPLVRIVLPVEPPELQNHVSLKRKMIAPQLKKERS